MESKNVIVLGGTRGFGFELAKVFAAKGCNLVVTGRRGADAAEAASRIGAGSPDAVKVFGLEADITSLASLERLNEKALGALGRIDLLIVNAGINQVAAKAWESEVADIDRVLATDLRGPMYAVRAFMGTMIEAGRGSIWFIEGLGSNGMMVDKHSLYGTSKRGLGYYWRALAKEAEGTGVLICALSPGMMITDFLMSSLAKENETQRAKTIRLYNILADRPETVARFAGPRILANEGSGKLLSWLTTVKVIGRFLASPLSRRKLV